MKIKAIFLMVLIICFLNLAFAQETEDELIAGIKWEEKENLLTYNLANEGFVKIRVGSYAGPVYRTIVNLEKRQKGDNQEHWDGKNEEEKIDFLRYGKLHFCVELPVKQNPDSVLNVKFIEGSDLPNKITVDVQEGIRPLFLKNGAELRVYLDNKLKKIERVTSLPFAFTLETNDISEGRHLLTVNLWQMFDFTSVAYNSIEVVAPKKKTKTPPKHISHSQKAKIAFSQRDKKGFWQVFTSALDGKKIRQLTFSSIDKRYPSLSPEGEEITYVDNLGGLWIIDGNGNNNRKITLPINCSEPKFSPDGKKIIFTSFEDVYHGSTKLWQIDLKGSELKKLVNRPWLQYNPSYSPDEKFVIFTDGPELFGQNILKLNLESGDITQITDNGRYDYDMQATFLNSGQEIIYSTNEGNGDYEVYNMDKFGRNKINLSRSPESSDIMPLVSKDDLTVFFLSDRSGAFQVWQMNIDGTEIKQLTNGPGVNSFSIYTES